MFEHHWNVIGEIEAGDVWAAVAEHPSIESVDRTHCETRTCLGFWLSQHQNSSRGRFLTNGWQGGYARLGSIVAIPGGVPFHVRSEASPERRMLHCRLPERVSLRPATESLDACLDLRNVMVANSLSRLAREVVKPGFGTNAIVEGMGLVIAGELERSLAGNSVSQYKGGLAPWQLRRIDDYLRAGHWNSSVSELAQLCGVTPGHAMRAFRQSTGRSIAAYIAFLRSDYACALLARDCLSVKEISSKLQFSNPSGFSAAFRRSFGMSPNEYRQLRRAKQPT